MTAVDVEEPDAAVVTGNLVPSAVADDWTLMMIVTLSTLRLDFQRGQQDTCAYLTTSLLQFHTTFALPAQTLLNDTRKLLLLLGLVVPRKAWGQVQYTSLRQGPLDKLHDQMRALRSKASLTLLISWLPYPTLDKPLGTSTRSRNLWISSDNTGPRSASFTLLSS